VGASVSTRMNAEQTEAQHPEPEPPADLQTQLEALLDQVWIEEQRWRREERIDRAVRLVRDA
jgi:hypothetical protein